jgi:hypothetical protein
MKKSFLIIALLFTYLSFGQEIEMKVNLLGLKFIQNEKQISWAELVDATEGYSVSNKLIRKARTHNTIGNITGLIGGGLIGIPLGQSLSDGDANWTLAYIGAGVAIISIPFSLSAYNKVNQGIDEYNLSLKSTGYNFQPEFNVIANGNGLGIAMKF